MTIAMQSFLSLGGNELVNAARLKIYVDGGIKPHSFDINPFGCDGLDAILPCVDSDPPIGGYQLPELDPAPWYDAAAPESANFAGFLVTEITVSAPYSRTVTPNINRGQTLGRLKLQGRTIVVHGWLIGKTCCATQYGLRWLTAALGDQPCADSNGCGGAELDFLDCCPAIGQQEGDCLTTSSGVFVRPSADTEYQRAEDFFRRMNGVGVVDGPNVLSLKGSNCGCGCAALIEVEFTLASSSPYFNSFGTPVLENESAALPCDDSGPCDFTWVKLAPGVPCPVEPLCEEPDDCLEDPLCPLPALPPAPNIPSSPCGCSPVDRTRICATSSSIKEWGSATFNLDVYSGVKELRNLAIRVWANPLDQDSTDKALFPDCAACSTLLISYIPANAHFILSGETRTVTIQCNGNSRNASQNVTNADGLPFDWPDIECGPASICAEFSCVATAEDATISVVRVDRDL